MSERLTWREIKARRPDTPARRSAYERAQRAHELGTRLRMLRQEQGMSQTALARQAGTTASVIARLELGVSEPRLGTLERVCAALGVDLVLDLRPLSAVGS